MEVVTQFAALFQHERAPMVRLAWLMVGSSAVAEEVVQDAFVEVLNRWGRLGNPGAYLRRCVVNGCLKHRRRDGHELRYRQMATDEASYLEVDLTIGALRQLSPERRALVVLRYYADMTQEEIARALRVPVGTVKSGLHRALAELREALADA